MGESVYPPCVFVNAAWLAVSLFVRYNPSR